MSNAVDEALEAFDALPNLEFTEQFHAVMDALSAALAAEAAEAEAS